MQTTEKKPQLDLLNLEKRKDNILNIKKEIGLEGIKSRVFFNIDYSGSMRNLYTSGQIQELFERLVPLAVAFDDDGELELCLFHDGLVPMPAISVSNVAGYVEREIIGKYSMGGTNYAPAINAVIEGCGGSLNYKPKTGIFSRESAPTPIKFTQPAYVIYITDGENYDKKEAENALRNASYYGIFFSFVGIGGGNFSFLQSLDDLKDRVIDNASFFSVKELSTMSDDELYRLLLKEYPLWIPQAKAKGLIV